MSFISKGGIGQYDSEALQLCWQATRIWKVFPGEANFAKLLCPYDLDSRSLKCFLCERDSLTKRFTSVGNDLVVIPGKLALVPNKTLGPICYVRCEVVVVISALPMFLSYALRSWRSPSRTRSTFKVTPTFGFRTSYLLHLPASSKSQIQDFY